MAPHAPVWTLSTQQVYATLSTSDKGLSAAETARRIKQYGSNELPEPARRSLWLRFADQLTHFMALLLWVAGALAFISGTPEVGWAVWAVIWINAGFSFWQEFQAEQALAALNKMLPVQAKVIRDGKLSEIAVKAIVPGDVMQLEEGDRISADARLVSAQSLTVDVSVLTGESLPIARSAEPVATANMRASEASNLVFAGSTVAAGRGVAVVYATGTRTEFGQVAHLTANVKREPSTLEVQINRVVHVITLIAVGMGVLVFLLTNLLVGMGAKESFIFAIGIIVAFVPEGLLPTVTLALAMGVKRMAQQKALVRRLSAVETLSATTVICTDKTGTLTKNEMTVCRLWIPAGEVKVTGVGYDPTGGEVQVAPGRMASQVKLLLAGAALCSNARLNHPAGSSQWQEVGDPTEAALLVAALKQGLNLEDLQRQLQRTQEVPFDALRRMMSVVLQKGAEDSGLGFELDQSNQLKPLTDPYLIVTKGSPLDVLQHCQQILKDGNIAPLSAAAQAEITATNDKFASRGYRVLAVAARSQAAPAPDLQELEQNLIFVGLVAMIDPPRLEVAAAIAKCRQAGIQVTMVTGDYGLTAQAIAQQIGLVEGKARVVTGEEMGYLSEAQLAQTLQQKSGLIFARVMPEQKLRLVQAYIKIGHIVAVTGDGVNDAPALRAANIGIAMGLNGTDVAREAADIVLLDDNFATIVSAIEQGRAVYQNIRKFITYILSSNIPELIPFLAMVFFKIPPALVILQILAIDLGTDMLPALALGAEAPEAGTLLRPPRKKSQTLLDRSLLLRAFCFLGLLEGLVGMTSFLLVWRANGYGFAELQGINAAILAHTANATQMAIYHQATTVTLAAIVACQVGNVFACRSERTSIFRLGFFSNRLIWLGIAVEWVLVLSIMYIPPLQRIFATAPLSPLQWSLLIFCPPLILMADELRKRVVYRTGSRTLPVRADQPST
jgi:potassium/sodium efflux P-type ATPase